TQAGAGIVTLSGVNTYTGNTNLNAGILSVAQSANLGSANNSLVFSGGTLQLTGDLTGSNRKVTLGAGGGTVDTGAFAGDFGDIDPGNFTKNGNGTMNVRSINANNLTVNAGILRVRASSLATSSTSILTSAPTISAA